MVPQCLLVSRDNGCSDNLVLCILNVHCLPDLNASQSAMDIGIDKKAGMLFRTESVCLLR